ncbi:hypothetical protein D3C76_1090000 [compost metagenome]
MPNVRQRSYMVGKWVLMKSSDLWLMSRYTQSTPRRFISWSMARATISRGASSSRGSKRGMKRSPLGSRSNAPSPRSASVIRKLLACGWYRQVGWNWLNSRLATRQPARQAMAIPSPQAPSGLLVYR